MREREREIEKKEKGRKGGNLRKIHQKWGEKRFYLPLNFGPTKSPQFVQDKFHAQFYISIFPKTNS